MVVEQLSRKVATRLESDRIGCDDRIGGESRYILLYFNNKRIIVFIDYNSINGIVRNTNFNTTSIDRTNRCFTNTLVYLSIYLLDVYYILNRLNFVLDILSRFRTTKDDIVRINIEIELTFDTI
jgi:hypothetical protein